MVWVPAGSFLMGSADFYPEEQPVRPVSTAGFWMDEHPVTVAPFRRFVKSTNYVTLSEKALGPAARGGDGRRPGSAHGGRHSLRQTITFVVAMVE